MEKHVSFLKEIQNFISPNITRGPITSVNTHMHFPEPQNMLYISTNGRDGIGHQLVGMYSCMVVDKLDPSKVFVKKYFAHQEHDGSPYSSPLFDYLQEGYLDPPEKVEVRYSDSCSGEVQRLCAKNRTACNGAKRQVTLHWHKRVEVFLSRFPELNPGDTNVAILHKRGGDMVKYRPDILFRYNDTLTRLVDYLHQKFDLRTRIFVETNDDLEILRRNISAFNPSYSSFTVAGDSVKRWIEMVKARILVLGISSYSISASLARPNLPTISPSSHPYGGRYDDNFLPCVLDIDFEARRIGPLEPALYFENGHGSVSCHPMVD